MRKKCRFLRNQADVQLYTAAAELPDCWDELAGTAMSRADLALYEAVQLPDITTYYASCGLPGAPPVAIACFQVLAVGNRHVNTRLLKGGPVRLLPRLLRVFRPKLLVAGQLFRHDILNFHAPGLSNMDAFRAYESMIRAVQQQSCALAVLVKDMPPYLVPYFQNYAPQYLPLRHDISMQLDLDPGWQQFSDYEASLKHKYAQKLRKVRHAMTGLELRPLSVADVQRERSAIYGLYRQVSGNQVLSLGFLNEDYLPALKQAYPDQLQVWGFYKDDTLLAFASAWLHPHAFDMFYIGFDYSSNNEWQLYFNILYFSMEQAINYRKPRLILGRTALEAKARLGCSPQYLYTFLYIRPRLLRQLVRLQLQQQYNSEGDWEQRHPFKQQP